MALLILVWSVATAGAVAIASAYDAAEGRECLGDLVARLAGEVVR